jgi:hypothetical protein
MKILLIVILFSGYAFAENLTLSFERSTPQGFDKVEYKIKNKSLYIHKKSNWFDEKKDLRLGDFVLSNSKNALEIIKSLEEINQELFQTNKKLKEYGKDFNSLNSKKNLHAPYFKLNDFIIQSGSILYPRLLKIHQNIIKNDLKLQNGVVLDEQNKKYIFYKDSKEIDREPFNMEFFCESPKLPSRCLARKWGALYLE